MYRHLNSTHVYTLYIYVCMILCKSLSSLSSLLEISCISDIFVFLYLPIWWVQCRLFLQGLEKYGKGDWKSISRYAVKTRNPTQVASHAQKHFERQEKEEPNKKRRSIFDSSIAEGSSVTKFTN